MAERPRVTLYTRAGCCLCDEAKHVLNSARRRAGFELEEIDIDADPELRRQYNDEVPVIAIDGRKAGTPRPVSPAAGRASPSPDWFGPGRAVRAGSSGLRRLNTVNPRSARPTA